MPQKQQRNICIIFSDTGGGHRSACDALAEGIRQVVEKEQNGAPVEIYTDNLVERTNFINKAFVDLYNYLLRHHQPLMKYYYDFLHVIKPNETEFGYKLCKDYFREMITRVRPSVIVSVHPMSNHYAARAIKDMGMKDKIKLAIVITDPNQQLWKAWACQDADIIIAPNNLVQEKLMEWGIPAEKIRIIGMPIHPDFLQPALSPRDKFLNKLGLSPKTLTICINAGWAGGGNMLEVYRCLSQIEKPLQVIFLCGHNRKLFEKAVSLAGTSRLPTAVLPFHNRMSDLMNACDLMVTKAGGLTTYQCVARHLPMVIDVTTEPMPQEKGTVDILVEQKRAYPLRKASDITDIVNTFDPLPNRYDVPLPSKYSLDQTDAVYNMARLVLDIAPEQPKLEYAVLEKSFVSTGHADLKAGWEESGLPA